MNNKKALQISLLYYIPILIYSTFVIITKKPDEYILIAASIVSPLAVFGILKPIKIKLIPAIIHITFGFLTASILLGSNLRFYDWGPYDKIVHFASGIIVATICYFVYTKLRGKVEINLLEYMTQC